MNGPKSSEAQCGTHQQQLQANTICSLSSESFNFLLKCWCIRDDGFCMIYRCCCWIGLTIALHLTMSLYPPRSRLYQNICKDVFLRHNCCLPSKPSKPIYLQIHIISSTDQRKTEFYRNQLTTFHCHLGVRSRVNNEKVQCIKKLQRR